MFLQVTRIDFIYNSQISHELKVHYTLNVNCIDSNGVFTCYLSKYDLIDIERLKQSILLNLGIK